MPVVDGVVDLSFCAFCSFSVSLLDSVGDFTDKSFDVWTRDVEQRT